MQRLHARGIADVEDDPTVLVQPCDATRSRPRVWFQRVPEAKSVKNRVHLDLRAADPDAEVARLVGLGAVVLRAAADHEGGLALLHAPEGHPFCRGGAGTPPRFSLRR